MNKTFRRIQIAYFLILVLGIFPRLTQAQDSGDFADLLKAAPEDASKLITEYVKPAVEGLSYGMTGSWYTTAKAHKSFGADLGISLNTVFLPSSRNYFNPNSLGLTTLSSFKNTTNPSAGAPTILGPDDASEYVFQYDPDGSGDLPKQTFKMAGPGGANLKDFVGIGQAPVPVPMVQLGVGIYKNTDLKIRFLPEQTFGSSKVKMLGFGVLHDIKQHIGSIKLMPFDLSALLAYNRISGSTDLKDFSNDVRTDNGIMKYSINSYIIQLLISKKISVLTVYGGFGYQILKSNIDILGDYHFDAYDSNGNSKVITIKDPVLIDFKNSGVKLTAGIRLKFGPFFINGDYTLQKYKMATVGFGFSFR